MVRWRRQLDLRQPADRGRADDERHPARPTGHASVQPQSTAYQWLALALFVLLALAAVALAIVVATVGGAP